MASNSYTSANITPSSDTFREWVDLTNRITYDMEKYVVTTAPAGNTQGAETIGNAHVNGYFGANTVIVFDGIAGATGNVTHYGTRAPAANLTIHTNTVFIDDGSNSAIINAEANVYVVNSGIQFTSNSTLAHVTINTTADVFESNAGTNIFNTGVDINADVDIDNALTDITSTNTAITGAELNVDANTVFTANINITADSEDLNIGSDQVIINSSASLFQSSATLNDFNSDVDIDADVTTITVGSMTIEGNTTAGEFDITSNVDIDNAVTHITATKYDLLGTTANLDSTTTNINGTTLDIDSATVDVDSATAVNFNSPDVGINGALLDINSTTVDVDGTTLDINSTDVNISGSNVIIDSVNVDIDGTAANLDSTTTNINGTTLDINSTTVDVDGTLLDITSTDVNVSGSNVTIDSVNVDIDGTAANLDSTTTNINGTTLDINSATVDVDSATAVNFNSPDVGINGALLDINSTTVDVDSTTTDINSDDINLSGANVTISSTNVNITSTGVTIGDAATDALTVNANTTLTDELNVQGDADFDSNVNVDGSAQIDTKLTVGGATTNAVILANGEIDTDGRLKVLGSAHLQSTANVDGFIRLKDGANITGTANVSQNLYIAANVHANTSTLNIKGTQTQGNTFINALTISVGNSEANTVITKSSIDTDGTLTVEGAADLANTLNVAGVTTLENTANSTSNTSGGLVVSGGIGVAKSATIGEDVTVHGDADIKGGVILGDATSDILQVKGRVNTHIVPEASATRALGTDTLRWDLYADDARTRILQVSEDATIDGNLDVAGYADVGYPFTVSNTTTTAFKVQTRNGGADREVIIGNTVPTATAADDRLVIRSGIGNSTIGLIPLHGNNVPLGDGDHRWIFSATTGDFSGVVNISATTEASSNSTGSLKVAGGFSARKKAYIGSDLVVEGTANVGGNIRALSNVDVTGTVNAVTGKITGSATITNNITAGSANVTNHANVGTLGVTGAADFDSTVTIDGAASLKGDVDLGDANTDTISFNGEVDTSIEPTANGGTLGRHDGRWAAALTSVNTSGSALIGTTLDVDSTANSTTTTTGAITTAGGLGVAKSVQIGGKATTGGDIIAGADIDVTGQANAGTLRVRGVTSNFEQANVHFGNSTTGFANVTVSPTVADANVNYVKVDTGKLEAVDLVITGSAVLPDDTTLTATSLGTANLTVTDTTFFSAAAANSTYTPSVRFGDSGDSEHKVIVNFENAVVNTNFVADATTRDIGTNADRWGEGHFESLLQVGGSSGIVLEDGGGSSGANVTADNIFARDELVGASTSDRNLKDNLLIIDTALGKIEQISGYEFNWNSNIEDERIGKKDYGVVAQEIEQILPHAVNINSRGYKTVNYNNLIPLLIEAVKELSGRVEELERDKRREENLDG